MSAGDEWIWGRQPVLEAVLARTATSVIISRNVRASQTIDTIAEEAARAGIGVRHVESAEIERVAPGAVSQGIAARVRLPLLTDIAELLDSIPPDRPALLVALDQVQDPHNLGAVLRSAEAAGANGVFFPSRRSATISGAVAKASAGAINHVRLAEVTNLARSLGEVRQRGLWVVGLEGQAEEDIFDVDLRLPTCLVLGSEEAGLRRLTREHCDVLAKIPMIGSISSLNASVAGGVALFEAVRQRRG